MASLIREPERPRKPWRVNYTDRRRRRTMRFATKREAERFIGELARGERAAGADRMRLDDWLERWLRSRGPEWEARTRRDRAYYADRFIVPHLGAVRLSELRRIDVRDWRAQLVREGPRSTPPTPRAACSRRLWGRRSRTS